MAGPDAGAVTDEIGEAPLVVEDIHKSFGQVEVLKVMRDLADDGRTMVVVTHEMGFAREVSNRVLFLHQGQVELDGDPDAVFASTESERFSQFLSRVRH